MEHVCALKGNVIFSRGLNDLVICPNHYLVCDNKKSAGVFLELPKQYAGIEVKDYGDSLIMPGMVDLHLHAPQYTFRGLGMDLELLDWLETHTFPAEARYADMDYAKKAYRLFVDDLANGATTRACVFATMHVKPTLALMEMLEKSGLKTKVGKVNMDRNCPDILREENADRSIEDTLLWLNQCQEFENTEPILTPRFIPTCSDELMKAIKRVQEDTGLSVQSHLSENLGEIEWVKELCPDSSCYGDAYHQFGLFGGGVPTIMAHCVHPTEEELELLRDQAVFVAHCPQSNTNLSSGIAPVRTYLEEGVPTGLGTDVAGGHSMSMFRAVADAIQVSKLRWRLVDDTRKPLTMDEAFYLATKAGGSFFGKVGSFEEGYEFDALVVDDSDLKSADELSIKDRLDRCIYLASDQNITAKYVSGEKIK